MGRPQSPVSSRQFSLLCNYLESNNECQFSLKGLRGIVVEISGSDIDYTDYYLKTKLIGFFKDRLIVHNVSGNKNVSCMSQTSQKVLDFCYRNREKSTEEERKRIVKQQPNC